MKWIGIIGFLLIVLVGVASCDRTTEPPQVAKSVPSECAATSPCAQGSFCNYSVAQACGETGVLGTCFPKPAQCTEVYKPVCGCDGRSYGNLCVAHSYGVASRHVGVCEAATEPPPALGVCGGPSGGTCKPAQFCKYDVSAACGEGEQLGACTERPRQCTREHRPVCGCDGRNYANECVAFSHGTSVRSKGLCGEAAVDPAPAPAPTPAPEATECTRAGCSGEICVEAGAQIASICQWREEYACYREATCEQQANGRCGWTSTKELDACLAGAK